jgi:hypothetical protein
MHIIYSNSWPAPVKVGIAQDFPVLKILQERDGYNCEGVLKAKGVSRLTSVSQGDGFMRHIVSIFKLILVYLFQNVF